ncbi:MAG: zf-HC2 domain-containing protein [Elusimicrobia bacterium]|nr:zf-HC2 domain-containing protein [Elusimicrobiota bacterium]
MTENICPAGELLSAYVDREANPSEERRIDLHLADCGACRSRVRSLGRLKTAVRNQPLPPLPAALKADLLALARDAQARAEGSWRGRIKAFFELLAASVATPAGAAAAAALLLALAWGGWRFGAGTNVPVDFVLAAHNEYARTMPLAATERIMTELPVQITSAGSEDKEDVY